MAYLNTIPIDEIDLQRIRELIDNQVCEDRHLEYKRELPGHTSGEKKEFLVDVTAMANSGGGDIIYGIEEKKENDEKPYSIKPISGQDADEVKQRLDSLLRNGIQPRLINYQLKEIKIENKSFLIILRIPRTLHTPYMVAYKGSQKFYTRNSSGKHPMDINEIRTSFLAGSTYIEKAKQWRQERLSAIKKNQTFEPLCSNSLIVVQMIPLFYEYLEQGLDVQLIKNRVEKNYGECNTYYNLEGLLSNAVYRYMQVFRSGQIETADDSKLNINKYGDIRKKGEGKVLNYNYERMIVSEITKHISFYRTINITPPMLIGLSLLGVKGYKMCKGSKVLNPIKQQEINRDDIILPAIIINDFNNNIPKLLKPVFDIVWNACGLPGSMNYDNDGKWIG